MDIRKLIIVTASAALLLAFAPRSADAHHRPKTFCSDSGDLCQSVTRIDGVRRFKITLSARFFKRYVLCLKGPEPPTVCQTFRIKAWDDGTSGSSINFRRQFGSDGEGRYTVSWFRVPKQGPAEELIGKRLGFHIR